MIEVIILLAHKMNLRVIAEGIETARQFERLSELRCELGQGNYFSHPLEAKAALVPAQQVAPGRMKRRERKMSPCVFEALRSDVPAVPANQPVR